ncbi:TRAFAC clade GTPase domain-containing protein [Plantactinospora soyae]|uniref:Double-GTPase 2 domain-containing protein n=1 Tax=Plantactinospora soyae TaxID=1544732 RepID=A0A927RA03_9ACTN|nr:hypothetical protein [Plantactinospora soyae]MBE1491924.1 hypothetical protein [Plantactinospora soyae]
MPTLVMFLALAAAIIGYGWLCYLVLALVLPAVAPVAFVAGVVGGLGLAMVAATRVLSGHYPPTRVLGPTDVAAGRLAGRVGAAQVRRDRAWPQYFTAQVRLDLIAVHRLGYGVLGRAWTGAVRPFGPTRRPRLLLFWPLLLIGVAGFAGFGAGTVLGTALVALLSGILTISAWLVGFPLVLLLRGADRCWQWIFRAGGSCPRCYEVTSLPAYRCPGPHSTEDRRCGDDLHRNVRPGRLGVLWRRCACGTRLPTTVLRASRTLAAHCPTCTAALHPGAAVATDVRVPVFGASSAGKTQLIMAALVALVGAPSTGADRPAGGSDDPVDGIGAGEASGGAGTMLADEYSRRRYDEYLQLVTEDRAAPKTDVAQQPVAVTVRIPTGRHRSALLHLFDAAGEALVDQQLNAGYAYLDYARTLLFVLDPFSVRDVRDQSARAFADVFAEANPAQHDPEDSYQSTVTRLRQYGVDTARQRLAFVVSKRDLIERLPIGERLGIDPDSIRGWLLDRGLDNLVASAARDFAEVRFFLVSSKDLSESGAVAPVRWLLETERVAVRPQGTGIGRAAPAPRGVPNERDQHQTA